MCNLIVKIIIISFVYYVYLRLLLFLFIICINLIYCWLLYVNYRHHYNHFKWTTRDIQIFSSLYIHSTKSSELVYRWYRVAYWIHVYPFCQYIHVLPYLNLRSKFKWMGSNMVVVIFIIFIFFLLLILISL